MKKKVYLGKLFDGASVKVRSYYYAHGLDDMVLILNPYFKGRVLNLIYVASAM